MMKDMGGGQQGLLCIITPTQVITDSYNKCVAGQSVFSVFLLKAP